MEEEIEQIISKKILYFLNSDYGKGFLAGMTIAIESISKQIPIPLEEDIGQDS
ncbi:hypothetical protein [Streptococcus pluranimalium]